MAWPTDVRKSDLRIEYYRGSGKGGQKKNKTSSACRITHVPTGRSASCEDNRSQTKNREQAFLKLAKQLTPWMKAAAIRGGEPVRSNERIRTYHEPRATVTDHRTGQSASFKRVLDGDIDSLRGAGR